MRLSSLASEQALRARFGVLPEGHCYYVLTTSVGGFQISQSALAFARVVKRVPSFVTDAVQDDRVPSWLERTVR